MQQIRYNDRQASWPYQEKGIRQSMRRLREEPLDAVGRIAADIGPRRATSLAEAQVAAYLDGRLRRAGLRVAADTFLAPVSVGWEGVLLGLLAAIYVPLYYWFPFPALVLALWSLAIAGWRAARPVPLLARLRSSQNVIGTYARSQPPRWRVVLLAPLDSSPIMGRWICRLTDGWRSLIGRAVACGLLALCTLVGLIDIQRLWWYFQFVPLVYLVTLALVDIYLMRAPGSPGATCHAGAIAVMLASAEALTNLQQTELWAVGLGATSSGAGLTNLLVRYPFEQNNTLFISLEGLGSGRLSYITRAGLFQEQAADPLLLRLAAATDAADPVIDIEPRVNGDNPTLVEALQHKGWRALAIACLDANGTIPYRASPNDIPDVIDPTILDRAVRMVIGLVHQIDATSDDDRVD